VKHVAIALCLTIFIYSSESSIPPFVLSCHSLSSSHFPSAAILACFGHDAGSKCANLGLASVRIVLTASGLALAKSAYVAIPAATKASAAFGPIPSTLVRSSAFAFSAVFFFGFSSAGAASTFSLAGFSALGSATFSFSSFLGASFPSLSPCFSAFLSARPSATANASFQKLNQGSFLV